MARATRTSWLAPYRISVAIILLGGVIAAVTFYREAKRREDERAQVEFDRRATLQHALTREVLQRYAEALIGLSTIFTLDNDITREEFALATAHLQSRVTGAVA